MTEIGLIEKPPVFKGVMLKRGSNRKNFLSREFLLEDGNIQYFEKDHLVIKGERNLAGYTIGTSPDMKANQILLQPPPHKQTHLFSSNIKTIDLLVETKSLEIRAHWILALKLHIEYATHISIDKATNSSDNNNYSCNNLKYQLNSRTSFAEAEFSEDYIELRSSNSNVINAPTKLKGWLLKRGKFSFIWKRRYVEITNGELNYYDVNLQKMKKYLSQNIPLENYNVELDDIPGKFILSRINITQKWFGETRKSLSMQCEVEEETIKWVQRLQEHIKFAKLKKIDE